MNQLRGTQSRINLHHEAEVTCYPIFNYVMALICMACSIYLIYSVGGGINSIPGFNDKYR